MATALAHFRVFGLDGQGRVIRGEVITCDDLAAAWELAKPFLIDYPAVEVWDGAEMLFRLGREPALER